MMSWKTARVALVLGLWMAGPGCKDDRGKPASAGGQSEDVTAKSAPANPGDAPQPASGPPPATQAVAPAGGGAPPASG